MSLAEIDEPVVDPGRDHQGRDLADIQLGLTLGFGSAIIAFHVVVVTALVAFAVATLPDNDQVQPQAVAMVEALEFSFSIDEQPSGSPIQFTLDNQGEIFHNMVIEGEPGFLLEAAAGGNATDVVELQPGVWVLYCSVPGHRASGMELAITVQDEE